MKKKMNDEIYFTVLFLEGFAEKKKFILFDAFPSLMNDFLQTDVFFLNSKFEIYNI